MATHFIVLHSWRIPWTQKPGRLQSMRLQIVGHNWATNTHTHTDTINCWNARVSHYSTAFAAKSLQSCPTLCDPIDGSPSGSTVPGILQARTLEWVAISFSNAWKWKVKMKSVSHVWPSVTPWTAAFQAPPSMGFSRQEYWSGVPLPSAVVFLYPNKELFKK